MVNKVTLLGRLGADPEVRRLENGAVVAKMSIATTEWYRDKTSNEVQESTEWHNIIMWRYLAERAEKQLKKGSLIYLEGKLTHRKYDDKDGNTKYITEVVAVVFRNLTPKDGAGGGGYFPTTSDESPASTQKAEAPPTAKEPVADSGAGDDLPF